MYSNYYLCLSFFSVLGGKLCNDLHNPSCSQHYDGPRYSFRCNITSKHFTWIIALIYNLFYHLKLEIAWVIPVSVGSGVFIYRATQVLIDLSCFIVGLVVISHSLCLYVKDTTTDERRSRYTDNVCILYTKKKLQWIVE